MRCLKLNRAYSISFNSSNVYKLKFLESNSKGLYQSQGKKKKKVVALCTRPKGQNAKLGTFTL